MSEEDETRAENNHEGFFFAAATPNVATTVKIAAAESEIAAASPSGFAPEQESASAATLPGLGAEAEDSEFKTPPRDYAADFAVPQRGQELEERLEQAQGPEASLFPDSREERERDLDVPTFLRRLSF